MKVRIKILEYCVLSLGLWAIIWLLTLIVTSITVAGNNIVDYTNSNNAIIESNTSLQKSMVELNNTIREWFIINVE